MRHGRDFVGGIGGNFMGSNEIENLIKMSKVDFEKQNFDKNFFRLLDFFSDVRQGGPLPKKIKIPRNRVHAAPTAHFRSTLKSRIDFLNGQNSILFSKIVDRKKSTSHELCF